MKSGAALRTAQIAALEGKKADVRKAGEAHRKSLAEAVERATQLAAEHDAKPGPEPLARMLEALSISAAPLPHPGPAHRPRPAGGLRGAHRRHAAGASARRRPRTGGNGGQGRHRPRNEPTLSRSTAMPRGAPKRARREKEAKIAAATRNLERARAAESQARRALARAEEEVRAPKPLSSARNSSSLSPALAQPRPAASDTVPCMFDVILLLHSWLRWPALIAGIVAIASRVCLAADRRGETAADRWGAIFVGLLDLQMLLGLLLYFVLSPTTAAIRQDFGAAMRDPVARFWAVEHLTLMVAAVDRRPRRDACSHARPGRPARSARACSPAIRLATLAIVAAIPWPGMRAGRPLFRV